MEALSAQNQPMSRFYVEANMCSTDGFLIDDEWYSSCKQYQKGEDEILKAWDLSRLSPNVASCGKMTSDFPSYNM